MTIEQAFNRSIDYYNDWMKLALPNYNDIFQTALEIIPFERTTHIHVLDLGAGTGLFSKHVFDKYPNARFVLYDMADKMLELARERFKNRPDQFEFIIDDYRNLPENRQYDLVISSLSIHHLTHEDKKDLFRLIKRILKNHGLFINIDQIRAETDYLRELYWNHWLNQIHSSGPPEEQIRESIKRRENYDIDATLLEQLDWLQKAGFSHVDCVYKNFFVGVFLAVKQ